ncbi:MAG: ABC transporter ATP-binding protein [Pseudanabaenaceae cyanobacterium bins.68]|nr:ABC transporter ATP-binding protein [Pseudanabaenaceae cyanobacterium bins.68]
MLNIQNLLYHPAATPAPILRGISLELLPQQLGVIVGASGSGKTTLLEILAGFVEWNQGSIGWRSQELASEQLHQICGLVFQFPERHFCGSTMLEELRLGHVGLETSQIDQAIQAVGLSGIDLNSSPQALSGGQQRRLALAVQLIRQPAILLLDEPTAGLDWSVRQQVIKLLGQLKQEWTILVVSHEPEELKSISDRTWSLVQGELTSLI